jgi:hypothetical protein
LQHFLDIREIPAAQMIFCKFLSENIMLPVNADGSVIDVDCININTGARVIMLAMEPDSYLALNDIFAAPSKDLRWAHIDNDALPFNEKWHSLADFYMNADDFAPENEWADYDQ